MNNSKEVQSSREEEGRGSKVERVSTQTPDLVQTNVEAIAGMFPNVISEALGSDGVVSRAIDFDLLRQELSDHVVDGPRERYQLDWPGKRAAMLAANAPTRSTLRPMRDDSVDFDTTKNLFIEGDNLEALKLLQESYLGKVKLIYIDPPYNTGNDFIYDDDFAETTAEYLQRTGQVDESGSRLVANTESNGRFHSDWLSMMYPRLKLARNLLRQDGLIAVSIDDHEVARLRNLMDEVFGPRNFIATVIWHKMDSPKNSARHLSEDHEYILLFARDSDVWQPNLLPRTEEMISRYKNPDSDPRGPWLLGDLAARNAYQDGRYPITTPSGRVIEGPPPGSYWRVSKSRFEQLDADGRIWWGNGTVRPGIKRFLSEVRQGVVPQTYWSWREVGSTRNSKQDLHKLMAASSGENLFVTPKPVGLVSRLLNIATDSNSLVLDFFAGSGTTAHAVMATNAQDGGQRRWISVQLAEGASLETEPQPKAFTTIAELSRERIRAAGAAIVEHTSQTGSGSTIDVGFRAVRVDSGSFVDVLATPDATDQSTLQVLADNIKPDRSSEDLLLQVMLDWGQDLSLEIAIERIEGVDVFNVDSGALIACLARELPVPVVKAISARMPLRAVFRDSAFRDDAERINLEQIFREVSRETQVKVI